MDRDDEWEPRRDVATWDEVRDEERGMDGGYTQGPDLDALRAIQHRAGRRSRAPRAYVRSDERIRDDVYDRLCGETGADATNVTISVSEGDVWIDGSVPDREDKRRIELVAESVLGVRDVRNRLRVAPPHS